MRKLGNLTFSLTSVAALLCAAACSSSGGGNSTATPAVQPFGSTPNGSAGTGAQTAGGAGSSGTQTGSTGPQTSTEGQGDIGLTGSAGSASAGAAGSTGTDTTVVDSAPQATPGGYFESGSWHGYAWTGDDGLSLGTTRSVQNFADLASGMPFCLSGSVGPQAPVNGVGGYGGVALLGFNVSQDAFAATTGADPTIGSSVPAGMGVAVNYTKTAGQTLRIQLQGADGDTNAAHRWCAELTSVQGPAFVPYTDFRTSCWLAAGTAGSVAYNHEAISAVVMTVPGDATNPVPYNVCIAGFADGNSVADAPTSISLPAGLLTGTLSVKLGRIKVTGRDGETYIINNNAWGQNSSDGSQQIRFTANSFEVLKQAAGPGGDSSPASFPSIYIGANGSQSGVNGATTAGDNPLPIKVSGITTLPTTFRHNAGGGDNNATYDVWFANNPPTAEYQTAQAAFLMVWTYKPSQRVAIGNRMPNPVTVDGKQWFLYVGPRGGGGPDSALPVMSYVNEGASLQSYSFDLNVFIKDAIQRNIGLNANMYLTDVFAGFEIWNGGTGLRVDEFSAKVNP